MKSKLLAIAATLLLFGCTTTQVATTRAIADPLVSVAVTGYAQAHGVPAALTAPLVTQLQNSFWGMLTLKYANQPIAAGAGDSSIGAAVAAKNPNESDLANALVALGDTAATKLYTTQP